MYHLMRAIETIAVQAAAPLMLLKDRVGRLILQELF